MLTVKNEEELLEILKSVCESATTKAKSSIKEMKDPAAEMYMKQYRQDEKMLGKLSEQEVEDEAEEPVDDMTDTNVDAEEPADESPEEDEAEPAEDFGVSFDSVIAAINALRSGRSLRDSSVKQQALDYYDRLDDSERKVLLLFLNSFADILTGEVQGSAAADPSEPPYSVKISSGDKDQEAENERGTPEQPEQSQAPEEESSDEEEDTSPPIRVNESQDITMLREKIRLLIK
tara:strand:- start:2718 stop:3416 length:699 start_codon:yes stop_codon:yes gene_type:complete